MGLFKIITNKIKQRLNDDEFKNRSRKKPAQFTRKRKMPFSHVMMFMLMSYKCSTQSALRRFYSALDEPTSIRQQSFSEARANIKVEAFVELFRDTVPAMTKTCCKTWNGYRVYAIDGTKIELPTDKKLADAYGTLGKSGSAPTAQGSVLYDVLNDIVADAAIEPLSCDERTLASWHINRCCIDIAPESKKLFIFDRGYPSFELIEKLENEDSYYVMRVKEKFNLDIDAQVERDGVVYLSKNGSRIQVRVIKFPLPSGEVETLITNITDKRLGVKAFKKLYFLRWPIETKFDIVKNKLNLEMFSARTVEGIQQDFWATMLLTNIVASAAHDAQPIVSHARADKNNTYAYRVNVIEAIAILKDRLIFTLSIDDDHTRTVVFQSIIDEIAAWVSPVRPNHSRPRSAPRSARFYHNRRVNC